MKYFILFVTLLISCNSNVSKESITANATFLPKELENNHEEQFAEYGQSGITEMEFNEVIDGFEQVFQPIANQLGLTMEVVRRWEDSTINAYAQREGNHVTLSMFGGLARHKYMNKLGFALVLCHEYSHIAGGYPFYRGSVMSVEGQSDIGSTHFCGKAILGTLSPIYFAPDYEYSPAMNTCRNTYDPDTCTRLLAGGLSLGKVLASLGKETMPRYETPDRSIIRRTMESHPRAQCRLDTYYAGTMCPKEWDVLRIPMNRQESDMVNCARPRCWFSG